MIVFTKFEYFHIVDFIVIIMQLPTAIGVAESPPLASASVRLQGIVGRTNAVAISPDGRLVACGGEDCRTRVFNETGRLVQARQNPGHAIQALTFRPDGEIYVSASGYTLSLEDFTRNRIPQSIRPFVRPPMIVDGQIPSPTHQGQHLDFVRTHTGDLSHGMGSPVGPVIDSVFYSSDGTRLARVDRQLGLKVEPSKGGLAVVSLHREGLPFDRPESPRTLTAMSGDVDRLVSVAHAATSRGAIKSWDVRSRQFRDLESTVPAHSCAMRRDGRRFLIGGRDGSLSEWDFDKGAPIRTIDKGVAGAKPIEFLAYSPDGSRMISGDESGVVRLYDAATGRLLQTRNGPVRPVRAAVFLPSKIKLASGGFHIRTDPKLPQAERDTAEPIVFWEMGRD